MKKFGYILTLFALFSAPSFALASEGVRAFTSHIEINKNGSASVQEEIVYDLGDTGRHGILREIPLLYQSSGSESSHNIEITGISVTDGHNKTRDAQFEPSGSGNVAILKIGDPDVALTGEQFYVIHYTIWGAVTPGLVNDQFSYDVTGDTWEAPIDRIRAEVMLPGEFPLTTLKPECLITDGSTKLPCVASSSIGIASSSAHMLRFEDVSIAPRTALTLSLTLPKGTVIFQQKISDRIVKGNVKQSGVYRWWQRPFLDFSLVIPFLIFAAMMSILLSERETRKKKRVQYLGRATYFLSGLVLIGISFYIPTLNLAFLLSGAVILLFSFFFEKKHKDA